MFWMHYMYTDVYLSAREGICEAELLLMQNQFMFWSLCFLTTLPTSYCEWSLNNSVWVCFIHYVLPLNRTH